MLFCTLEEFIGKLQAYRDVSVDLSVVGGQVAFRR